MNESTSSPPGWNPAPGDPSRIVLSGAWTLEHAKAVAERLRTMPRDITILDANRIERVDSAGVAQLIRHAHRMGLDDEHLLFRAHFIKRPKQGLFSDRGFHARPRLVIKCLDQSVLDIARHAFIDPQVPLCCSGGQVARPAMCKLMRNQ